MPQWSRWVLVNWSSLCHLADKGKSDVSAGKKHASCPRVFLFFESQCLHTILYIKRIINIIKNVLFLLAWFQEQGEKININLSVP